MREGVILYAAADNLFDAEVAVAESGYGIEGYGAPRTIGAGLSLSW